MNNLLFLTLGAGFLLLSGCGSQTPPSETVEATMKPLHIRSDHRLETLYFVFLLADYPLVSRHSTAYKQRAAEYFEPHKAHPAVSLALELFEQGFVADYPVNWVFQCSPFPDFEKQETVDFPFDILSSDSTELFREALIDFYHVAECEKFLQKQQPLLDDMTTQVWANLKRKDIISVIENYFGIEKPGTYELVLSPLVHQGGFGVEQMDHPKLIAMVGPNGLQDSMPGFDHVFMEQDMVIHEFSHNYGNPIIDAFLPKTSDIESWMFPLIKEAAEAEGYGTWEAYLYELLVRSTTIRIVHQVYGPEAARELMDYEESAGFGHSVLLSDLLKTYEANRQAYATLHDFFPEILKWLRSLEQNGAENKSYKTTTST